MVQLTRERIQALTGLINGSKRVTVVTHTRPDGDAVGSSVALATYLRQMHGKDVRTVIANPYSDNLEFILDDCDRENMIRYSSDPEAAEEWICGSDLVFCLDCNTFGRTDELEPFLYAAEAERVLIDHHLSPKEEDFSLVFSETAISSACEVLYRVLLQMPDVDGDAAKLPHHSLRALMAGMTTDTNNFGNSVYPSTLEMASDLLAAGVDRDEILGHLYNSFRENRLRLMGYLMYEKMKVLGNGTAYIIIDKETQDRFDLNEGETEGFVNMPLSISEVKMSIMLKEDDGYFRVSVRSKKGTSANMLARTYFNGGGHEQASGGRLYIPADISDAAQAAQYIEKVTEEFFR